MSKNILEVSKIMFINKKEWSSVSNIEKSQFFFIFNRYFSKKYPRLSMLLNDKNIDKVLGMDLWFNYIKDKPYPKWFWSKSKKSEDNFTNEYSDIMKKYDITEEELQIIIQYYPEELKEELDYLKSIEKSEKK